MFKRFVGIAAVCVIAAAGFEEWSEDDDPQEIANNARPELTDDVIAEQTKTDFDSMDTNSDGFITRNEIEEYLNDPEMEEEIEKFFQQADSDSDGNITIEEYREFVKSLLAQYEAQTETGFEEGHHDDELVDEDEDDEL